MYVVYGLQLLATPVGNCSISSVGSHLGGTGNGSKGTSDELKESVNEKR